MTIAKLVRKLIPLKWRLSIVAWLSRNRWLPYVGRFSDGLIRDLKKVDPKNYHKFLWGGHLDSYGRRYEPADLFSDRRLNGTREAYDAFTQDLEVVLQNMGTDNVLGGVLDIGCSSGCFLRELETKILPDAEILVGVDIDHYAITSGNAYLSKLDSKIRLLCGDLEQLDRLLGTQNFDFSLAAGSLSYLNESDTREAVWTILGRTSKLVAFMGLANPYGCNDELEASVLRGELGGMWTHNFGAMVEAKGWEVLNTRWKPPHGSDSQGLYTVFASPSDSLARSAIRR